MADEQTEEKSLAEIGHEILRASCNSYRMERRPSGEWDVLITKIIPFGAIAPNEELARLLICEQIAEKGEGV